VRFLVDECCPRAISDALRAVGHDVVYVAETQASASDAEIAIVAASEARIIVTQDYDFGEMAVRERTFGAGVLLIACQALPIGERAARVIEVVRSAADQLRGNLVIIEARRVRRRPL
jgi:predicted nuclease of predicted toxin-antitoxin system